MEKIKTAIIGLGFIGQRHLDMLKRIDAAEIIAVADADQALAESTAQKWGIPHSACDYNEILELEGLQAVHNCTPNHLHFEVSKKAITQGLHVFCEKPLAISAEESGQLIKLLQGHPGIVNGVNFNYRMYTMAREAKELVCQGEIGKPRLAFGSFLQDWMLWENDYSWRVEPELGGASRAVADIGSHWMDLMQFITGDKISEVCADVVTVLPTRIKSVAKSFEMAADEPGERVPVATEDYASVLFKTAGGMSGTYTVSQVSAGHKGSLQLEISGSAGSVRWEQETPEYLWIGRRDKSCQLQQRDPSGLSGDARKVNILPGGHPEGWNDALYSNIKAFYWLIRHPGEASGLASFRDGHEILLLTRAILQSSAERRWVHVER